MLTMLPALAEEEAIQKEGRQAIDALQGIAGSREDFDAAAFIGKLLSGELNKDVLSPSELWRRALNRGWGAFAALSVDLAFPMGIMLAARLLLGARSALRAPELLCTLYALIILAAGFANARAVAGDWVDKVAGASGDMTPVLTSIAALSGAPWMGSAFATLSALLADLLQGWLREWGIGLSTVAAAIALAGSLSPDYPLNRLFSLIRSVQHWLLGGTMFIFTGLVTAQGAVGAAKDGLALQAARSALENVIPIIGGSLSDAAGALTTSVSAFRNALGITGIVVLARLCLGPFICLLAGMLSMKMASALTEPVSERPWAALLGRIGEVYEMLLATCAAATALAMLLMGLCMAMAGSVGG